MTLLEKWTDFGNPRVMVLIEEKNLDNLNSMSSTESAINTELSLVHYQLLDPELLEIVRKSDEAKKCCFRRYTFCCYPWNECSK